MTNNSLPATFTMMDSSNKAYLMGALGVGTSRVIGLGAGFLSLLLLTRILTKDDFASYAVAYSAVILLGNFVGLGLERSLVVEIGRFEPRADRLIGARLMLQIATVSVIASAVGLAGLFEVANFGLLNTGVFLTKLAPVVLATALSVVLIAWYQANHRAGIGMSMQGLNDATRCAVFALAFFAGWGPSGVISGAIIGAAAPVLALGFGALGRYTAGPGTISRDTWTTGLKFQIVRMSWLGFQHLDIIVLGVYGTPAATAQYVVASRFAFLIETGLSLFSPTFAPRVRRHFETGALSLAEKEYKTARVLGFTGAICLALVFLALGRPLLELASGFDAAVSPFLLLIGANLLTVGLGLHTTFLSYTNKLHLITINRVVCLGVFVVSLFLLVPRFDATGAALAYFISIALRDLSSLMLLQRFIGIKPLSRLDLSVVIATAILFFSTAFGLIPHQAALALLGLILAFEIYQNRSLFGAIIRAGRDYLVFRGN